MKRAPGFPIPLRYIILDAIGSVLIGLGLYGLLVKQDLPGFEFLQLQRDAWQFIVGGFVLMAPMVVHVMRNAHKSRQ